MARTLALTPPRPIRRRNLRHALLLTLASLTLALGTPTPTAAQSAGYLSCVEAVGQWYDGCSAVAMTVASEVSCLAVGVVGILGCAVLEAIRHLGEGVQIF
jgi:ABC-type proline/glycine betaine transport system permease subunit